MLRKRGNDMDWQRRPELLWRAVLVAILIFAGLLRLGEERAVPSAAQADVTIPGEDAGEKLVALTFDDGPRRSTTTALLDGLKERGARATFFLIGMQIAGNEALIERMAGEGHQIGVHTLDHVLTAGMDHETFTEQVEGSRRLLYALLGEGEYWLRPPYGILDENVKSWADTPIVLWSVDPEDWKDGDAARVSRHVLSRVRDGDIVLLHDIYPSSVEAALEIVDVLQKDGWRFVTVGELLNAKGVLPESGGVYQRAP